MGDTIHWFKLGSEEKLFSPSREELNATKDLLQGQIYSLFKEKIQVSHLQLHHYCQPRQNETMQGRAQFDEKNTLTLIPVIEELEQLYFGDDQGKRESIIHLHIADANLDELAYRRTDLLLRLQKLVETGNVKISGGILDEAFIGPDDESFAVAAIISYFDKIESLFGKDSIVPIVWIPERFFEKKAQVILQKVYEKSALMKTFPYISVIVDENVIEHSLDSEWSGNIYSGWKNPKYSKVRIFVSSNQLRAMMPQATPEKVNSLMFSFLNRYIPSDQKDDINWFVDKFDHCIDWYADYNQRDDVTLEEFEMLNLHVNRFYLEAEDRLKDVEKLFVFFVDDLEKNGSWEGTTQYAFEEKRHFYQYLAQARNYFNPYQMGQFSECQPVFKKITTVVPSSYKEFSIVWNNDPADVEKWRQMTMIFLAHNVDDEQAIKNLDTLTLKAMKLKRKDANWYLNFIRTPISWQDGQFSKYPEIKLNYQLAQIVYKEILNGKEGDFTFINQILNDDQSMEGNLLHIWNKNRASCPNFIGFFGGASILFFRLHVATQLATVMALKYHNQTLSKEFVVDKKTTWQILISQNILRILDEWGDVLFSVDFENLHNLVSGFVRHREGYSSLVKEFSNGRLDAENFALVEKYGGTTSEHPLVVALDLDEAEGVDIIKQSYPEDLDSFDTENQVMNQYPNAWEQVWILDSSTVDSPAIAYKKANMDALKWKKVAKYFDGSDQITYVREATFKGKKIEVIKKVNTRSFVSTIEIWNRSKSVIDCNPVIAYPTALDWFEGENYSVEGEGFPLNGDERQYYKNSIDIKDRISNLKLNFNSYRDDTKFSLTTAYTYQTSDKGTYSVSPQHELVLLSSNQSVVLGPGEGYFLDVQVDQSSLTSDSPWDIDWKNVPDLLKLKLDNFVKVVLKDQNYTEFQKTKMMVSRYPELIFWANST
jgi:hypothetical protein